MPIKAWICRGCGNREVPLDHFATTKCGEEVVHPDYAAAALISRKRQRIGVVRVSHGVACVRRVGIEQKENYAIDPLDLLASMTGVAWHALMEEAAPKGEAEVSIEIAVDGVKVVGTSDRPRRLPYTGELVIDDWKTKGDYQFSKKVAQDAEYVVTQSMYAHALGATRIGTWYKSHSEFKPMYGPVMPIEKLLEHKPHEGEYTVRELYHQADDLMAGRARWQDLPLAGQSMRFGRKSACDYCSVRETCTIAAMGNPWG